MLLLIRSSGIVDFILWHVNCPYWPDLHRLIPRGSGRVPCLWGRALCWTNFMVKSPYHYVQYWVLGCLDHAPLRQQNPPSQRINSIIRRQSMQIGHNWVSTYNLRYYALLDVLCMSGLYSSISWMRNASITSKATEKHAMEKIPRYRMIPTTIFPLFWPNFQTSEPSLCVPLIFSTLR